MPRIHSWLSLIKFSHTLFALPFAIIGFLTGWEQCGRIVELRIFLLVLGCMVFARSAAMAFNRWADRDIDRKNPRTAGREIPAGKIRPRAALVFTLVCCLGFILCTVYINRICFYLSPLALLIILGYSYTKRFTALAHFILGLGLSMAPIGAYLAVCGHFALLPLLYTGLVIFWVAGFDILYSLQDHAFDVENGLKSVPSVFGLKGARLLAGCSHALAAAVLLLILYTGPTTWVYGLGAGLFCGLLLYQHLKIRTDRLHRVGRIFALSNSFAGLLLLFFYLLDFFIRNF